MDGIISCNFDQGHHFLLAFEQFFFAKSSNHCFLDPANSIWLHCKDLWTALWGEQKIFQALCLTKPITSAVRWACQLNLTDGLKDSEVFKLAIDHIRSGPNVLLQELHSICVIKAFIFSLPLKGSPYLIGQAVLWLHPWHHSHHPRCTHQQLWNYQASGAERRVYAAATWGKPYVSNVLYELYLYFVIIIVKPQI